MKTLLLWFGLSGLLFGQRGDRLNGIFFQFDRMDAASTAGYLEEQAAHGVDKVMTLGLVTCPGSQWTSGVPFDIRYDWLNANIPQVLPTLLSTAQRLHMRVYLGLVNSEGCGDISQDPKESAALISWVTSNYPQYLSAIGGWYLPDEPYIQDDRWLAGAIPYYAETVASIRRLSLLPIVVSPYLVSFSPFFYGIPPGGPAGAALSAERFLQETGIDILAYEDGAGGRLAGGAIGWSTFPNAGDFLRAVSARVGPSHLWVIHELPNATFGVDEGFGAASIARLSQQIAMIPDAMISGRFTWTAQYNLTRVVPARYPEAERLLAEYEASVGLSGRQIVPNYILWYAPVRPIQPMEAPVLKDGKTGDPFNLSDPQWVCMTVPGSSGVQVDFPEPHQIDWVDLHTAKQDAAGVRVPDDLAIWYTLDGIHWDWGGVWTFTTHQGIDGERAVRNNQALGVVARSLWLYMPNSGRTCISELTITGR